ncbi:MAG: hypothetical protein PG981_000958 [Wolbachia endosymbiont of Ctenocephalides orientis wCori]|nr:MAG: hypothetical protein PG981_000958 [Wolbachia endosymbiont of Ctenocephalides orientis wCori]
MQNLLTEKGNKIQSLTADNENINETVKRENTQLKEREKELEEQVKLLKGEKDILEQQKNKN